LKERLHGIAIENRWSFAVDAGANWSINAVGTAP